MSTANICKGTTELPNQQTASVWWICNYLMKQLYEYYTFTL